jgi:hypothetical protein
LSFGDLGDRALELIPRAKFHGALLGKMAE